MFCLEDVTCEDPTSFGERKRNISYKSVKTSF